MDPRACLRIGRAENWKVSKVFGDLELEDGREIGAKFAEQATLVFTLS